MKIIYTSIVTGIALLVSTNSFAVESVNQQQLSKLNGANGLTKEQRYQQRQLFLQQKKQIQEERNKVLRAQHTEKFVNK